MKLNQMWTTILAVCLVSISLIARADDSINTYTEKKLNIVVTPDQPEFVLKLRANPTTGYAWFLREYNSRLINPVAHHYQQPDAKLIGAGGFDVWTFRATRAAFSVPQQTTLRMVYVRPWENDTSSTQLVFRVSTQR